MDSLAALSAWSGLHVDRFVRGGDSKKEPEPLAVISSCLRSDPRLNEDTAVALDQMVKQPIGPCEALRRQREQKPQGGSRGTLVSALNISSFIWRIADDVLRDVYVRGKCGGVILPMTIVRLLDPVLEPTEDAVLRMKAQVDEAGRTPELSTTRSWRAPLPSSWQTKLFK